MTCTELRARLDDYARGSLSPAESLAFETHLTRCEGCSALLEEAEALPVETAALARSVEPEADWWPAVKARLAPRVRRSGVPGWLLAAAALLLIAVSSTLTALLLREPTARPPDRPTASALAPLETQYASAIAELAGALERARARLAPGTIATIERNLAVIDSALAESRRALAGDPGNALLEQLVVAAWRQKVDFLRRATALPAET